MFSIEQIAIAFDLTENQVADALYRLKFDPVDTDANGDLLYSREAAAAVADYFDVQPEQPPAPAPTPTPQAQMTDGIVCKAKLIPDDNGPRCEL
jgi:hypothetical protein